MTSLRIKNVVRANSRPSNQKRKNLRIIYYLILEHQIRKGRRKKKQIFASCSVLKLLKQSLVSRFSYKNFCIK